MLDVFKEYLNWSYIMGLNNAGDFNLACEEGHATDLINVAEALQEKKIAQIADTIFHRGENGNRVKLVLIAGPSSSGKTTFSQAAFNPVDDKWVETLFLSLSIIIS